MSLRLPVWLRLALLPAFYFVLGGVGSAQAAADGEPIFKVLQFYGLGAKEIDAKTESVDDGLALPGLDDISDADILASEALRKAIRKFHDDKGINRGKWSVIKAEIERIRDMRILARTGNRVNLRVDYRWRLTEWSSQGGHDSAEVLVEVIPSFSNETYDRERYGEALAVEDSYFADVAREIADLGLAAGHDDRECFHNYHSPNPCIESIPLFERFAARHGFELSVDAAYMFQAFVRGEYGRADRLYARAKGYTLPTYEGVGTEVAALGLRDHMNGGGEFPNCDYNYYSPNPCAGVIRLWQDFAERHGLGLSRTSADMFEADTMRAAASAQSDVVVEASDVTYISSAGLRAFLRISRTLKRSHRKLHICGLKPHIEQIFEMIGFNRVIPIHADVDSALTAADNPSNGKPS